MIKRGSMREFSRAGILRRPQLAHNYGDTRLHFEVLGMALEGEC